MFFSQYFSFPLSVSFHPLPKQSHSPFIRRRCVLRRTTVLYVTHLNLKFWTAHLEGNFFLYSGRHQQTKSLNTFQVIPQTLCTVTHMAIQGLPLEERATYTLLWVPLRIASLPARKIYNCCINRVTDIKHGECNADLPSRWEQSTKATPPTPTAIKDRGIL